MGEKEFGESTIIKIKLKHVFIFLGGLTTLLVSIIGFFYRTMTQNIDEKLDEKIYNQYKEYLDEKFNEHGKTLSDIESKLKETNQTIQTIGTEVLILNREKNNINTEHGSNNINNEPSHPTF